MTAPKIFKLYIEIYNNYLANNKDEQIINKVKKIIEADDNIKGKTITNNYEVIEKQKKDIKKQSIFNELKRGLK